MRAAVYEGEGRLVVRDVPDPTPAADEVLIEVEACGVCGSDVQIINVPPGHPSTPPVDHRPRVRRARAGRRRRPCATSPSARRVVVDPDPKCGACDSCRAGRPANCTNIVALGVHRDGALARYVTAPANSVYPISADVSGRDGRPRRAARLRRERHEPGGASGPASRSSCSGPAPSAACSSRSSGRRARRGSSSSSRASSGRRSPGPSAPTSS